MGEWGPTVEDGYPEEFVEAYWSEASDEEIAAEEYLACSLCSHSISGGECGVGATSYFVPGDVVCTCCVGEEYGRWGG